MYHLPFWSAFLVGPARVERVERPPRRETARLCKGWLLVEGAKSDRTRERSIRFSILVEVQIVGQWVQSAA